MTNPTLRAIANDLRRLDSPGAFAAHHPESGLGLGIEVQGVGECRFPLATERIRELMAQAIPSPFGYFEQTLHDRTVRDSWEIEADRIRLDPRAWEVRLTRGVQAIAAALGFPPEAVVTPTLRKLLIYEPGQFFARHRDSEKEPGTVATLAIVLPSTYTGGEIVVTHGGQQLDFATAAESLANRLAFLGFYVDCVHETRPVSSGYRVVLTFTLQVESARLRPVPNTDRIEHLRASLARYFRLSDGDWLVHLLQHQYSEQGIDWGRLKNGDRIRAEALRRVARDLDCVCFLALADAVEGYDYHGPDLSVDDGEEDDDPSVPAWVALAGP
ncbi:MAG: 2OG-Fe(II) oxygenase, partial [Myxococcales bacterium]|nr:2OG-Fe(II) oxygenase [Myxococcales bacterium]